MSTPYRENENHDAPFACLFCGSEIEGKSRCPACGEKPAPSDAPRAKELLNISCPRCFIGLEQKELPNDASFLYCIGCHGCFVPPVDFGAMIRSLASLGDEDEELPGAELNVLPAGQGLHHGVLSFELACPVCAETMKRATFARANEVIDVCKLHGIWFDAAELSHVMKESKHPPKLEVKPEDPNVIVEVSIGGTRRTRPRGALAGIARFLLG